MTNYNNSSEKLHLYDENQRLYDENQNSSYKIPFV